MLNERNYVNRVWIKGKLGRDLRSGREMLPSQAERGLPVGDEFTGQAPTAQRVIPQDVYDTGTENYTIC